ncbi:DUF2075 domain-containing protein [Micromonospora coxensis]|uniref:DUF2075 domain-containing protein n=1 Tax=Micromonospora coxensis TaxID=356852 RepID=UPI00342DD102
MTDSERSSWRHSLPALAEQLVAVGLGDLDALVECQLPRTSRRIDVLLAGAEPLTRRPAYLVVELKQWSAATVYDEVEKLVRVPGLADPQLHPALQVESYCSYLVDFLSVLWESPDSVHGLAFLHNADRDRIPVVPRTGDPEVDRRRMVCTRDRVAQFHSYLTGRFGPWRDEAVTRRLLDSPVRPSRQLLALTAEEVGSRDHLVLLDEQRAAYELVMRGVRWADRGRRKRVVLVSGGPGSGKSAIALTLLADLAREGRAVAHATGSKAFKKTVQRYARSSPRDPHQRTAPMFHYFLDFMDSPPNSLDVLICDEAHRIRNRSTRGRGADQVVGRAPQIRELIEVAKVPVFLLDDDQVVRPNEVGSVTMIREAAEGLDLDVDFVHLGAQFRCGGSPRYERWVRSLLGLSDSGWRPYRWPGDDGFRVALAESPQQMETLLRGAQERGGSARISAGFCWPWSEKPNGRQLVPDVKIGSWARPWNAAGDHPPSGVPSSSYWATDPRGFDQIGCIYTAQGFEYDYSGVILGEDLVVRNGKLVCQPDKSRDSAIVDRNGRPRGGNTDRLIRNAYKVLLTRGMRGTIIYSVDRETQEFLAHLVPPAQAPRALVAPGVQRVAGEDRSVAGGRGQPSGQAASSANPTAERR